MIGFFGPTHRRAPVGYVRHAGLADLAAADGAIDAFDTEGAATQEPRDVAAMNLTACNRRRRRRERHDADYHRKGKARADKTLAPCHNRIHADEVHFRASPSRMTIHHLHACVAHELFRRLMSEPA